MQLEDVLRAKKAFLANKHAQVSAWSQFNPFLADVADEYHSYLAESASALFQQLMQQLPNDDDRRSAERQWAATQHPHVPPSNLSSHPSP